jgi:hypothetical protein
MSSTLDSALSSSSRPAGRALRLGALASASALTVALLIAIVVPAAHAAHVAKARVATLRITGVTVKSTTVDANITVTGRVKLPSNTAKERKRAEVYLTLISGTGKSAKSEAFTAKLTSKDTFTATYPTTLTGALGLEAVVKIAGKQSGKKVVRTVSVAASGTAGATGSAGTTPGSTTPGTPGSPGSPGSPGGPSGQGTTLNGTFELQPGAQSGSGALSGTYFRMVGVPNPESTALNQEYTLLLPGTDGGLETFAYQEPPTPAFAGVLGTEPTGNALADRIVQPQTFFDVNFSIVTAPVDEQEGLPNPLPVIVDTAGKLSGQITDWDAQWNGQSFNQGSPKSNGTFPAGTTPLSGSYDAATGRYVLTWSSLIVGGPFDGKTGEWHLEGTFVPHA